MSTNNEDFPVNYPPQETSKEILQARDDLMEAIQAFLKEYDHIPPNEKCMALLLAEERFLKIKQNMEEEQNQPEVLQELLLKHINDLQILKGIQQEKKKPTAQRVILKLGKSVRQIKDALTDKQYRQEDIQELISELLEDVRNIREEFSEYTNCPSWNRPLFYFDDDEDDYIPLADIIARYSTSKAITLDLPIEEPNNSLSMGDEHLSTIPVTESDKVIKSSVKILVPIPSELEGISDDTCDEPVCDDSSTFDALNDNSEILSNSNDDDTSSDDDDFKDVEYVSLEEVNDEKEFDLEDIFQIQDVILRKKLLNFESFHFDPSFPRPPPEPLDVEISLDFEPDAPVIDNFNEHNDDQRGSEIDFLKRVKMTIPFTFVHSGLFLPVSHLPRGPLLYLSFHRLKIRSLTPGISTLELWHSQRDGTFIVLNVYPKH
ncbi:hypothetical protein Tco_1042463 [Tanacetum coccineum]|uniref:Uncharacterized protein n=1 Tax=Tanacetum coccineum TaxID=301880 RepID=A0ABQ5GJS9_9ASTR